MATLSDTEMETLLKMLNRLMDKEVLSAEECRVKERVEGLAAYGGVVLFPATAHIGCEDCCPNACCD